VHCGGVVSQGRRIVAVEEGETTDDLTRTMVEMLTSSALICTDAVAPATGRCVR
jgi:DUF1009 family protein